MKDDISLWARQLHAWLACHSGMHAAKQGRVEPAPTFIGCFRLVSIVVNRAGGQRED